MFYTALSRDGYCYIPSATILDEEGAKHYSEGRRVKPRLLNRSQVTKFLDSFKTYLFEHETLEEAIEYAEHLYKKMPRYCRQIGYAVEDKNSPRITYHDGHVIIGAGTLVEEIAERYN